MPITNKPDELVAALTGAPQAADALRDAHLRLLAEFSQVERAALDVERKRLEAKYGAKSPQAQAAAARLALLDREQAAVQAELERRSIPTPAADPESFVVFGRVLSAAGEPLRAVTVTALAPAGTQLASAGTGDRGTFELRVPIEKARQAALTGTSDPRESEKRTVSFHLQVSSPKSGLLFKEDEVIEAVGDRITYREVIVPDNTTHG